MMKHFTYTWLIAVFLCLTAVTSCQKEEKDPVTPATAAGPSGPLTVYDNVLVVDSTRHRLDPTPALLDAGTYKFTATGSALELPVGAVIVGAQGMGFLRKVTSSSTQGNVTTVQTLPASLDEVFRSGTLKLRFATDSLQGRSTTGTGFNYSVSNLEVLRVPGTTITVRSAKADLNPNWTFEAGFGITGLETAEVAAREGTMESKMVVNVTSGAAYSVPSSTKRLARKVRLFRFLIPAGPLVIPIAVLMVVELNLKYSGLINSGFSYDVTFGTAANYNVGIAYSNSTWKPINEVKTTNELSVSPATFSANANIKVSLEPKISLLLYATAGPYGSLGLQSEFQGAYNGTTQDRNYQADAWCEARVGVGANPIVLGKKLPDYSTIWTSDKLTYKTPEQIELTAGDNQQGSSGQALPTPIKVRVLDSRGKPQSGVPVYFVPNTGSGRAVPDKVFTNADGYAQTIWTLDAIATGPQQMKVSAKTATGSLITNAPILFTASIRPGCIPAARVKLLTDDSTKTWRVVNRKTYNAAGGLLFTNEPYPGHIILHKFRANGQYTFGGFRSGPNPVSGGQDSFYTATDKNFDESYCPVGLGSELHFFFEEYKIEELTATRLTIRTLNLDNNNRMTTWTLSAP